MDFGRSHCVWPFEEIQTIHRHTMAINKGDNDGNVVVYKKWHRPILFWLDVFFIVRRIKKCAFT